MSLISLAIIIWPLRIQLIIKKSYAKLYYRHRSPGNGRGVPRPLLKTRRLSYAVTFDKGRITFARREPFEVNERVRVG